VILRILRYVFRGATGHVSDIESLPVLALREASWAGICAIVIGLVAWHDDFIESARLVGFRVVIPPVSRALALDEDAFLDGCG
jgi:hypothetical protein